ncbi:ArnT family glycosyltransferase [Phaeovulum sp.]|uniref:ArnT family glycosyltransferase n=1 Tax=Phaeovulum sp. TaxID=2934796 RepID=UPI003563CB4F
MANPDDQPTQAGSNGRAYLVAALVLFFVAVLSLISLRPLMPLDETRYLAVAWEMWTGGSKFVPHLNGELYSHKPPMLFWLINLVWSVTGPSGFAARMVGPAFGLIALLLTAVLARLLWPNDAARPGRAALVLASTGVFLFYGSSTMFDVMLAVGVLVALIGVVLLHRDMGWKAVAVLASGLAFGVLAKGPVALLHVLPVALSMPLWAAPDARPPLRAWYGRIGLAVLIAFGLVMLWLGPALVLGGPEYRYDVLWRQSAGRMVESFAHVEPFWFYLALVPVYLWPWGWSRAGLAAFSPRRLWSNEGERFVAVWLVSVLLAFSAVSGKLPHYLVPEMPAAALLLACALPKQAVARLWRLMWLLPALAVLALGVAIWTGAFQPNGLAPIALPTINLAATVLILLALVGVVWWRRSGAFGVALVAPATLLMLHLTLSDTLFAQYSTERVGQWLGENEAQGIARFDPRNYHGEFNFTGRLQGPLPALADQGAVQDWALAHPGGALVSVEELAIEGLILVAEEPLRGRNLRLYRVVPR